LAYRRRLAVDEEHRGARTTRINRAMQAVGERTCRTSERLHVVELPSPSHSPVAVLFVVTVFLIAQLAAIVYNPYPGPSVALDVRACPQFMAIKPKSVREPSGTCAV
jgi:hypothetical protein